MPVSLTSNCCDAPVKGEFDNCKGPKQGLCSKCGEHAVFLSGMVRVQLDVPRETIEDIESMMKDMGLATRKDFYEFAVFMAEWAVSISKEGKEIATVKGDKIIERVDFLPLFKLRQRSSS